jgi:hypothetical protein
VIKLATTFVATVGQCDTILARQHKEIELYPLLRVTVVCMERL